MTQIKAYLRQGAIAGSGEKHRCGQDICIRLLKQHALRGSLDVLWEFLKTKAAGGNGSCPKKNLKHWKKMVSTGLAREGRTHIHFVKNSSLLSGESVRIDRWMLDENPKDIVFLLLQAWYLRASRLKGKKKAHVVRNARLVSNENHGGICLETMGRMFGKTKQWASWMRRRVQSAGWCSYRRRWSGVGEDELFFANVDGDPGRYARHKGEPVKELVSSCRLNVDVEFKNRFSTSALGRYENNKREGRP